jgi:glycosyltransferase involved in cell wall biosynthesis
MKSPLVSATIGVPALNESRTIGKLISSILQQCQDRIYIQKILVVSDGSTDDTVAACRSFEDDRIEVIEHTHKAGKVARIKEILATATSDFLILTDGDVVWSGDKVLDNMLEPMLANNGIWLTSGRPQMLPPRSLFERYMGVSQLLQDYVKQHIRNGDNLFACHGRLMGVRHELQAQLLPDLDRTSTDDAYFYLGNRRLGHRFALAAGAICLFRMPGNLADFRKQSARFSETARQMADIFGDLARAEFAVPRGVAVAALVHAFLAHPLDTTGYVIARISSLFGTRERGWQTADSTKHI